MVHPVPEQQGPRDGDAAVAPRPGAAQEVLGLTQLVGVELLVGAAGGPGPSARETTQPPSLCISAWSSATVHRSSFSSVSVSVQGWNSRIWPPRMKYTLPVAGQPSVPR